MMNSYQQRTIWVLSLILLWFENYFISLISPFFSLQPSAPISQAEDKETGTGFSSIILLPYWKLFHKQFRTSTTTSYVANQVLSKEFSAIHNVSLFSGILASSMTWIVFFFQNVIVEASLRDNLEKSCWFMHYLDLRLNILSR